ncbi:ORF94 peptide [Hyphantria cunea nucleopolyhedrovirus]|uniref:ORF94 peptide n=1 Tax=Hyphantria cunea nuclear polyhedrosis virus TaxID=28288 RepID=Q2NP17_NPVHC|nr:ORF94 peptide [Hyphantria cunea nucleopolyhedrovirus]BAE72383.1 ORF94 peptide [Hyphantria cunea nucleopolyhedrovirus]
MLRALKRRFKLADGERRREENVVLCPRCYFVAPGHIAVADYTRMHIKYNEQFADQCSNNFAVTQPKTWLNYTNCPALYYQLC